MKLGDLETGQTVYVDTNIWYMYLRADPIYLPEIKQFLHRVITGELTAYASVLVLDELIYRLLLAKVKDTTGQNPLDILRRDTVGTVSTYIPQIETSVKKLMALPHITVVGNTADDFPKMLTNMLTFSLLPRDALHLAIMQRLKITHLASDDKDFQRITGITRHYLINPP